MLNNVNIRVFVYSNNNGSIKNGLGTEKALLLFVPIKR